MSEHCWACGGGQLIDVFSFDKLPISSLVLVESREEALTYPLVNMSLVMCRRCGFAFNSAFRPDQVDYTMPYESSQIFSPRFRAFADELVEHLISSYDLHGREILEIGSGDGSFLEELCRRAEARGIAIDPTFDASRIAEDVSIDGLKRYYDETTTHLTADLICCRHTLEHIQPVADFVSLVRKSSMHRPGSTVFFEIPDTERIFEEGAFWDIYNEHCSYFTIPSLAHLFESQGFDILRIEKGFNDQYLLIDVRPGKGANEPQADAVRGIVQLGEGFGERAAESIFRWRLMIDQAVGDDGTVVLWGASSKAVAFLSAIDRNELVTAAVDINPFKQNKYLPGSGVEVVAPEALLAINPRLVIVMNPIYVDEIRDTLSEMSLSPVVVALGVDSNQGVQL